MDDAIAAYDEAWNTPDPDGEGIDVVECAPDGRLKRMVMFLDR